MTHSTHTARQTRKLKTKNFASQIFRPPVLAEGQLLYLLSPHIHRIVASREIEAWNERERHSLPPFNIAFLRPSSIYLTGSHSGKNKGSDTTNTSYSSKLPPLERDLFPGDQPNPTT